MSIYMKVVSLNKPDNFHKGRLCLGEIWRTRQKFRRTFIDIRVSVGFGRVFDQGLTQGVLTWSRGSIGIVGSVFEVMAQVDLGLTNVG
jgi:hypothetical protein